MHIPLTPEANLQQALAGGPVDDFESKQYLLDQLLGLDVPHAMDTGNTITIFVQLSVMNLLVGVVVDHRGSIDEPMTVLLLTYPTERTRPVSARPASSETPRILCSRMEETSVGWALASA
jgi:hypothetical protein